MKAAKELSVEIGIQPACMAMGVARATFYRERQEKGPRGPRPRSKRALSAEERQAVLNVCHSEEFVDRAPRTIQATLMDRVIYLCSSRTIYRILDVAKEVKERRNQSRPRLQPRSRGFPFSGIAEARLGIWHSFPQPTCELGLLDQ
jgi:putative transposase